MTKEVTSLALSQRLRELGVKFGSNFVWHYKELKAIKSINYPPSGKEVYFVEGGFENNIDNLCSAFTAQELLDILPTNTNILKQTVASGSIKYHAYDIRCENSFYGDTLAESLGLMLCHLLENKLI